MNCIMDNNVNKLSEDDMLLINGGGLAGSLAGGIFGFTVGAVAGTAATIYYGDTSGKILVKWMYTGTCFGAACGVFAPV